MIGKPSQNLESGRDYPKDWSQFQDQFREETDCRSYLEALRWPNGFVCPKCAVVDQPFRAASARLICRHCRRETTVTAGTIFDKTRTPLRTWFAAAWHVTHQKGGVSALGLQRVLGLGSYTTAWGLLHRLRRAMVNLDREPLIGVIEVDETLVAAPDPSRPARRKALPHGGFNGGTWVAVAVERSDPRGFGRVRLRRLAAHDTTELTRFVQDVASPGATIHTDGTSLYRDLTDLGYVHQKTVQARSQEPAHQTLPAVHRVASLLKRWLLGTHQGAVGNPHLDRYLEEFTFRFNRRRARSRGLLFYRLLEQAVSTTPETYAEIVASAKPQDVVVGGAN